MFIQFWKLEVRGYLMMEKNLRNSAFKDNCGMFEVIFSMIFIHFLAHRYQNYKVINLFICQNEALIYHYQEPKPVFQYIFSLQRIPSSSMAWKNQIFSPISTSNSPKITEAAPNDLKFGIQVYFYVLYEKKSLWSGYLKQCQNRSDVRFFSIFSHSARV